jgi:hypothetical protein
VDLISWFLPYYSDLKFYSRARVILGDGTTKTNVAKRGINNGGNR